MRAVFIAALVSIAAVSARKEGESDIVVRPGPDTVHFGGYELSALTRISAPTLGAICPF